MSELERLRKARDKMLAMAEGFDRLSLTEQPDPHKPTPLYVSRVSFEQWADDIRRAFRNT